MPDIRDIFKNRYKKPAKQYGYGNVKGIPVGTILNTRKECSDRGLHGPTQAGIHGHAVHGVYSVVLSGGYEDDVDEGDKFSYTGEGGRQNGRGPQVEDQDWKNKNNRSLKISCGPTRHPVRVIRGHTLDSPYAPAQGYRYDGLYKVAKVTRVRGKSGFLLCRFLFIRLAGQPSLPQPTSNSRHKSIQNNDQESVSSNSEDDESADGSFSERVRSPSTTVVHDRSTPPGEASKYRDIEGSDTENAGLFGSEMDEEVDSEPLPPIVLGKRKRLLSPVSLTSSGEDGLPSNPQRKRKRVPLGVLPPSSPPSTPEPEPKEDHILSFSDEEENQTTQRGHDHSVARPGSRRSLPLQKVSVSKAKIWHAGKVATPTKLNTSSTDSHTSLPSLHSQPQTPINALPETNSTLPPSSLSASSALQSLPPTARGELLVPKAMLSDFASPSEKTTTPSQSPSSTVTPAALDSALIIPESRSPEPAVLSVALAPSPPAKQSLPLQAAHISFEPMLFAKSSLPTPTLPEVRVPFSSAATVAATDSATVQQQLQTEPEAKTAAHVPSAPIALTAASSLTPTVQKSPQPETVVHVSAASIAGAAASSSIPTAQERPQTEPGAKEAAHVPSVSISPAAMTPVVQQPPRAKTVVHVPTSSNVGAATPSSTSARQQTQTEAETKTVAHVPSVPISPVAASLPTLAAQPQIITHLPSFSAARGAASSSTPVVPQQIQPTQTEFDWTPMFRELYLIRLEEFRRSYFSQNLP